MVEGNSIRATCRMTGHSKGAVLKLLAEVGAACLDLHDRSFYLTERTERARIGLKKNAPKQN
jgi:hypothetical protein